MQTATMRFLVFMLATTYAPRRTESLFSNCSRNSFFLFESKMAIWTATNDTVAATLCAALPRQRDSKTTKVCTCPSWKEGSFCRTGADRAGQGRDAKSNGAAGAMSATACKLR